MGSYQYVLRASKQFVKKVHRPDFGTVSIGTYMYAYKPCSDWDRNEYWSRKLIDPSVRAWEKRGNLPTMAVRADKWSDGCQVWLTRGRVEVCDDVHFDSTVNLVGTILKVGRSWHLEETPDVRRGTNA